MTKQLKVGLFALIIIAIAAGIYFINASSQSNSAQAGYDLYQQGDTKAAVEQFQKNADNDPQSAYALAMMYKDGIGIEPDDEAAQRYLIKPLKLIIKMHSITSVITVITARWMIRQKIEAASRHSPKPLI